MATILLSTVPAFSSSALALPLTGTRSLPDASAPGTLRTLRSAAATASVATVTSGLRSIV